MQTNAFMPRGAWILGAIGFIAVTAAALWQHQPRQPVASTALLTMLLGDGAPHPANDILDLKRFKEVKSWRK